MPRLLIVVTRQNDDSEIATALTNQSAELYIREGLFPVGGDRRIWVIPKKEVNGVTRTYDQLLKGLSVEGEVGVVIHNDATGWDNHGIAAVLTGEYKRGHYTTLEIDKYAAHKALGHCVSGVANGNAEELFDKFWNLCFKDPILEDLITLLRAHALAKANGTAPVTRSAIEGIQEYSTMAEMAKAAISDLTANASYEEVRDALVAAVKAQDLIRR